jgi:hypothetical protein
MAPSISFPPSRSATMETLDRSNWPTWSLRITALLRMNGLKLHLTQDKPADTTTAVATDWDAKEEIILGVLEMYCQKDVWTSVSVSQTIPSSSLARLNGRRSNVYMEASDQCHRLTLGSL